MSYCWLVCPLKDVLLHGLCEMYADVSVRNFVYLCRMHIYTIVYSMLQTHSSEGQTEYLALCLPCGMQRIPKVLEQEASYGRPARARFFANSDPFLRIRIFLPRREIGGRSAPDTDAYSMIRELVRSKCCLTCYRLKKKIYAYFYLLCYE